MIRRFAAVVLALTLMSAAEAQASDTLYGVRPGNQLIRFSSANPNGVVAIPITGLAANQTVRGIDFRPRTGQLYAVAVLTGSAGTTELVSYVIDPRTGRATLAGQTAAPLPGAADIPSAVDFNPTVDRLRYVTSGASDENARLNPNNGALGGDDTNLNPAATTDIIAAAYDRTFDRQRIPAPPAAPLNGPVPTTLYAINRNNSMLARQGGADGVPSPDGGAVTSVGSLGFTLNASSDGGLDIAPTPRGERAYAALTDDVDDLTRLYEINLSTGRATAIGPIGGTQVFDLAIAPHGVQALAARRPPLVSVVDALAGNQLVSFFPYPLTFRGGVRVALGDTTGDGVSEIVTAPGPGRPPLVRVFRRSGPGVTAAADFLAYGPNFRRGVFVACGDLNGDGFDDIITGSGAGSSVKAFDSRTGELIASFRASGPNLRGGVRVASADFDLNGTAEIVTAVGQGGVPKVRIFDGSGTPFVPAAVPGLTPPAIGSSFLAFPKRFRRGVFVAAGNVNGDPYPDVITGAGAGSKARVKVFSGGNGSAIAGFLAYKRFRGGVRVGATDGNGDGRADILTGPGAGLKPRVRIFDAIPLNPLRSFFPLTPRRAFRGGVFVAGER